MKKVGFLSKFLGLRQMPVLFLAAWIAIAAPTAFAEQKISPKPAETDKEQVVHQVANNWIQVGLKQHQRSFYKAAEQSFLQATAYKKSLTTDEWEQLNRHLERTRQAMQERTDILKHVQIANQLVEKGLFINAKAHLEKIRVSGFLTEEEQMQIAESIGQLNGKLAEQQKKVTELYNRTVEQYNAGQLQRARAGFIEVAGNGLLEASAGMTAEDYLTKIDNILGTSVDPLPPREEELMEKTGDSDEAEGDLLSIWDESETPPGQNTVSKLDVSEAIAIAEPFTEEAAPSLAESNPEDVRKSIRQSYAKAVVKAAVANAQAYIEEGRFYLAKEAVEIARKSIAENRQHLGEDIFKRYDLKLRQLSDQIYDGRTRWLGSWNSANGQNVYSNNVKSR